MRINVVCIKCKNRHWAIYDKEHDTIHPIFCQICSDEITERTQADRLKKREAERKAMRSLSTENNLSINILHPHIWSKS